MYGREVLHEPERHDVIDAARIVKTGRSPVVSRLEPGVPGPDEHRAADEKRPRVLPGADSGPAPALRAVTARSLSVAGSRRAARRSGDGMPRRIVRRVRTRAAARCR